MPLSQHGHAGLWDVHWTVTHQPCHYHRNNGKHVITATITTAIRQHQRERNNTFSATVRRADSETLTQETETNIVKTDTKLVSTGGKEGETLSNAQLPFLSISEHPSLFLTDAHFPLACPPRPLHLHFPHRRGSRRHSLLPPAIPGVSVVNTPLHFVDREIRTMMNFELGNAGRLTCGGQGRARESDGRREQGWEGGSEG